MENENIELSEQEVQMLNSKIGLRRMFGREKISIKSTLRYVAYENRLEELQREMIFMQEWVIKNNEKVVVIFEGRDAAGKGGAIRRVTEHINPRNYRIVALDKPTSVERDQWYFQRYVIQLPKPGEIVFFDRSWYNRAIVEPVNGFCSDEEYQVFMKQVNNFETMITETGTRLVKLYFSISKLEQAERFEDINNDPLKRWKMSPVDENAQGLWDDYTTYKKKMFKQTSTVTNPWYVIKANRKTKARIEAVEKILELIPYTTEASEKKSEVVLEN